MQGGGRGCKWQCQQCTEGSWMGSGLGSSSAMHTGWEWGSTLMAAPWGALRAALGSACPTWARRAQKEKQPH